VGTLRPFCLLPQGLYHDVPEGCTGLGLNGRHKLSRWEVGYDVIGGVMEFEDSFEDAPRFRSSSLITAPSALHSTTGPTRRWSSS
jgi:hypothetical protein